MSKINDGGFAFPLKNPVTLDEPGMTLRDYFAAKAMQSMLLSVEQKAARYDFEEMPLSAIHDTIAAWSYLMADAMLKVRKL